MLEQIYICIILSWKRGKYIFDPKTIKKKSEVEILPLYIVILTAIMMNFVVLEQKYQWIWYLTEFKDDFYSVDFRGVWTTNLLEVDLFYRS